MRELACECSKLEICRKDAGVALFICPAKWDVIYIFDKRVFTRQASFWEDIFWNAYYLEKAFRSPIKLKYINITGHGVKFKEFKLAKLNDDIQINVNGETYNYRDFRILESV